MNDDAILALARRAGLAVRWRDYANTPHRVSIDTLRGALAALDLPCGTAHDLAWSQRQLASSDLPPLITATAGLPVDLPTDRMPASVRVTAEDGAEIKIDVVEGPKGARLGGIQSVGYHRLELDGRPATLAVAPSRCFTVADVAPDARLWGLAAQIYGLRHTGDCGIGDMAAVAALARGAASLDADALAMSPLHASFAAEPSLYGPYAPSTRLLYNPLYADPRPLLGDARVDRAAVGAAADNAVAELFEQPLIDWPASAKTKMSVFRHLFEDFASTDLASGATPVASDFLRYCEMAGGSLQDHAAFEALQAAKIRADPAAGNWRQWSAAWRDPRSKEVETFRHSHQKEILFHCFLQWLADRSLAAAHQTARQAGMRIGLIADLAIGMSGAGSHAWMAQSDIFGGLEIGAPPDLFNREGQNWGLTTFSPRALRSRGFAPFIATLRACLRHCGGLRIDHAMGLLRLWLIPRGAGARGGVYLAYPFDDLLRLIALESHRHRAIIVGEDLGTVPSGFRNRLSNAGIYGMRVLWFERRADRFVPPQRWSADAVAMTSTHDLPTVAGWWHGRDIEIRNRLGLSADPQQEEATRQTDRRLLWQAFRRTEAAVGRMPPPEETAQVGDAAADFIARTPSPLALLPLEDALGLEDQPNLPGTIDQHPNWRRRYPGRAQELLDPPGIRHRLAPLRQRGRR